jgi:hypothetical protein
MRWIGEQPLRGSFFDDLTGVHHSDPIGASGNDSEIVRDQQDGHAPAGSQVIEHLQDLGLHRHVQRGRGLVGYQDLRLGGQGYRDHDPLPHAAAQLVRIRLEPLNRIGNAYLLEQLERPFPGLSPGHLEVGQNALDDLIPHREHGIQAGHGILKDHADSPAPYAPQRFTFEREHVGVGQPDGASRLDATRGRD